MFRCEEDELRQSSHPSGLHLWVEVISGHQNAVQVGNCASFKQNAKVMDRWPLFVSLLYLSSTLVPCTLNVHTTHCTTHCCPVQFWDLQ